MRVLLVNDCPAGLEGFGGVETHVRQLRDALTRHGVETSILAHQLRGRPESHEAGQFLIPDFNAPPLRKHVVRNFRQHRSALNKTAAIISRLKPDVIHIHNLMNPGALHVLRRCGPVVKSIHDCRPFCVKPYPAVASRLIGSSEKFCDISFGLPCWHRCYACSGHSIKDRIEAWSYFPSNLRALREITQVDQLVVYSQYLKDLALCRMPDAGRIHTVCHFTEAESASAGLPATPAGGPVFLFAGRLSAEKGILQIFDALARMPNIPCRLIIAGDGPLRTEVERRCRSCRYPHKAEMKGFLNQPALYELYRQVSVLLFPSIGSEGCPLSGIEAMYFGVPAIGYDTGGVGEWLVNGETGILLPRGDIGGLACAMTELVLDPGRRARLGEQAREFVRLKFRQEEHVNQLIRIYELARQNYSRQRKPPYVNW